MKKSVSSHVLLSIGSILFTIIILEIGIRLYTTGLRNLIFAIIILVQGTNEPEHDQKMLTPFLSSIPPVLATYNMFLVNLVPPLLELKQQEPLEFLTLFSWNHMTPKGNRFVAMHLHRFLQDQKNTLETDQSGGNDHDKTNRSY